MTIRNILAFPLVISLAVACHTPLKNNGSRSTEVEKKIAIPDFNADSAYEYTRAQVAFGPRVPNTQAHRNCSAYLSDKLKSFGAKVFVQEAELRAFDQTLLQSKNIIGSYNPTSNDRVLLCAHWDSRPFADHDPDPSKRNQAIDGANDGASGVGILLEIARQLQQLDLPIGIDIVFFDAEDYGTPDHLEIEYKEDTWCLGSQYWAKNPHVKNYYARYGILLDMVGAAQATFFQEQFSVDVAPHIVKKIWDTANKIGYGSYFPYHSGGMITDDHVYVNKYLKIPMVDIIQYDPASSSSFGTYWHTHNDTMDIIDRNTLKAVGQTVLTVVLTN